MTQKDLLRITKAANKVDKQLKNLRLVTTKSYKDKRQSLRQRTNVYANLSNAIGELLFVTEQSLDPNSV
jgi:hypothetical protein